MEAAGAGVGAAGDHTFNAEAAEKSAERAEKAI